MVKITVKSGNGNEMGSFDADNSQSIASQGASAGVLIPTACGIGACGLCVADVEKGEEFIEVNAFGTGGFPTMDGQILTCISGIKADAPADAEIILSCANA